MYSQIRRYKTSIAQLSQRNRTAGWVSFGRKWKTGTGKRYFADMSLFNHCDVIGLQSYRIRWKKRKIRAIMPFKVIQGHKGRYQSKARMRLPWLILTDISYLFKVIADYCSNFGHFAFLSHPLGSLDATYDVHLWLIGKLVVDFLLVIIEFFFARRYGWGTTSEYRLKIGVFAPMGSLWPKISDKRGRPLPTILLVSKLG